MAKITNKIPKDLIKVTLETSLYKVTELIIKNHIHRVWIVNEKLNVVGLITVTDILSKF